MPEENVVRTENLEEITDELYWALYDAIDEPSCFIDQIVLGVLDDAQREGRINQTERIVACNYARDLLYGYDF